MPDAEAQTIAFHARHRDAVLDGSKTVTVRWDEGIVPGPAVLRLDGDERVSGIVRSVAQVAIADLTPIAVREPADADMTEYVRLLRTRYYPAMPDDAVLEVVTFVVDGPLPEGRDPAAGPTR